MRKLLDKSYRYLIWIILVFFAFIYAFVAVVKHNHFQTGLDFGIYVQTFWSYIHLLSPHVTFYPTYGDLVWADHFTPSLILLAPFYLVWSDPKMLLILQAVLFVLGAYPIYRFSKETLKSEFLSLSIVLSYLLFFGTQFALTFDFHAATYSAIFLPWMFWFMFKSQWKRFIIFFLLTMGAKEDTPLLLSAVSVYLIISRKNVPLGITLSAFSFIYFLIVTKYLMPSFSYLSAKTFNTPQLPTNIIDIPLYLINSPIKIKTIFLSLLSFLFLPLLSGWFFLIAIAHFFINFISKEFTGRWDIFLHYRVHLSSILTFSTILGIKRILDFRMKKERKKVVIKAIGLSLVSIIIILDIVLHLPLNSLFKPNFYQKEQWMLDNLEVIKKIPENAYLLTQNNLAPHVANRKNLSYFPKNLPKADYIFVDLHENQPIINFWLSGTQAETSKEIYGLVEDKEFKVLYQKGQSMLLKRIR